jgi:hypothetical protein
MIRKFVVTKLKSKQWWKDRSWSPRSSKGLWDHLAPCFPDQSWRYLPFCQKWRFPSTMLDIGTGIPPMFLPGLRWFVWHINDWEILFSLSEGTYAAFFIYWLVKLMFLIKMLLIHMLCNCLIPRFDHMHWFISQCHPQAPFRLITQRWPKPPLWSHGRRLQG